MIEKIIVVTKKTPYEELIAKFNTKAQANFYINKSMENFNKTNRKVSRKSSVISESEDAFKPYEDAHIAYQKSVDEIQNIIPSGIKYQYVDREFLPNFLFSEKDLIITLGPDGLVINTAKYLNGQPIVAINPDPDRIDGILIPFTIEKIKKNIKDMLEGKYTVKNVSMAKAELNDGQILYGVNDIFVGSKTHVSFRYSIEINGISENQSSSGIIVSTGAGSTGWFKSVITGARSVSRLYDSGASENEDCRFDWESRYLYYNVREPFPSKMSGTNLVFGRITENSLLITSSAPQNGVIFSDGMENDYLEFNSGKIATIGLAEKVAKLVIR